MPQIHDLSKIHGSNVVREGVRLLDEGAASEGDTILFPCMYRLMLKGQPRNELVIAMREIQSFTCCKRY